MQRGGVFSLMRLERCGDSTACEDDTSHAKPFLEEGEAVSWGISELLAA